MGRFAAIDIGANSILLLIAETNNGAPEVLTDLSLTTRLGRGLRNGGVLDRAGWRATIAGLKRFSSICEQLGVAEIACVATSPLRMAADADDFIQEAMRQTGIAPRVISEQEEAMLAYLSVESDPAMPEDPLVMDVGGGSTEFTFREKNGVWRSFSLPLGAVTITEGLFHHDPPTPKELAAARERIDHHLQLIPGYIKGALVGIGGTATALGAMRLHLAHFDPARVHALILYIDEVQQVIERLQGITIQQRKKLKGLPPQRADIILAGAMIVRAGMHHTSKDKLIVSCRGVRYGLFYQTYLKKRR